MTRRTYVVNLAQLYRNRVQRKQNKKAAIQTQYLKSKRHRYRYVLCSFFVSVIFLFGIIDVTKWNNNK